MDDKDVKYSWIKLSISVASLIAILAILGIILLSVFGALDAGSYLNRERTLAEAIFDGLGLIAFAIFFSSAMRL